MSRLPSQVQLEALSLAPPGFVFPDDPDSYFAARLLALSTEISLIEASMEAMLPQVDLRVAYDLLPDYQRVLGPDPCGTDLGALSFDQLAGLAFGRWTAGGNICAGYLIRLAAAVGSVATVEDVPAWVCGGSTCSDMMVPYLENFELRITLTTSSLGNFVCGASTCDDSLGTFEPNLAQCPITHAVPLHCTPYFNYLAD